MNNCELLAPAGSYEAVLAAINAGADAVYLGASQFSARAYAKNLSESDIIKAIRLCHLNGVKVYLTLNTLLKIDEIGEVFPLVLPLYESGLDGVIVQDLGVIDVLKNNFSDLELHASTQMSIMNSAGANLLKKYGFSRIVPARELTLNEVSQLKKETGLEIECFIHGAMCYSYSGLCLMSSMIGSRSGNRGRCAGTCRLPFSYCGCNQYEYPLSMKDMCTIGYIPSLIKAGIDSFKIEGRMKSPAYVGGVTALYRKYIDKCLDNDKDYFVEKQDLELLKGLYIRKDICEGYYEGKKGRCLLTMDLPGYLGSDEAVINDITEKYVHQTTKHSIDVYVYAHKDEPFVINMSCGEAYASFTGNIVEPAINSSLTEATIIKQISKLGDTSFQVNDITVDMDDQIFISIGALNEYRRKCINELENEIINSKGLIATREFSEIINDSCEKLENNNAFGTEQIIPKIDVLIYTKEQLSSVLLDGVSRIYLEHNLFMSLNDDELLHISEMKKQIYVSLPVIFRSIYDYEFKKLQEKITFINEKYSNLIEGILAHDIDELGFCKDLPCDLNNVSDASIYVFNQNAVSCLEKISDIDEVTLPYELTLHDLHAIKDALSSEKILSSLIVYGRIPMMVTAGCLKRTYNECNHETSICVDQFIKDRKNSKFPVYNDCSICTNVILNDRPLSLYNMLDRVKKLSCDRLRIDLTVETRQESKKIVTAFVSELLGCEFEGISSDKEYMQKIQYTTGHIKRGVE